jgi:hypothetical protein
VAKNIPTVNPALWVSSAKSCALVERSQAMGASSWIYYVPYQEDLEKAFQSLRQHVFETDDYSHWWEGEWVVDITGEEMDISRMQEIVKQEDGSFVPVPPLVFSRTLEEQMAEVVRRSGSQGTHSILDINRLTTDSRYYGGVPLPEEVIQDIFAWAKPTTATVEAIISQEHIWSRLQKWFEAERLHIAKGIKGPRIYGFSDEILHFFATERSKEEVLEAFLTREEFWMGIHRCLCSVIEWMAMETTYGTAMPFSTENVLSFFGHERPTRADVEAAFAEREIWERMRRGMGYYAVIYQDDVPQEIVFAGFSGD